MEARQILKEYLLKIVSLINDQFDYFFLSLNRSPTKSDRPLFPKVLK
jgi:hypothetical protein